MRQITDLFLFKQHTRDSYKAKYGVDAPSYNPALPPKSWVDDTAPNGGTYKVFQDGKFVPLVIADVAHAAINLPGIHEFPPYLIDSTSGAISGMNPSSPYNAFLLSNEADAKALMADLGGSNLEDGGQVNFSGSPVVYLAWETRRMWQFRINGQGPINVGTLLAAKNKAGVGAPGHWDVSNPGTPVWVSTQPVGDIPLNGDPVPVPCSDLLPGETVQKTGIFGFWTILSPADAPQATGGNATGWSSSDEAFLKQLVNDVAAIKAFFRIQ